jgi:hypothetical protein
MRGMQESRRLRQTELAAAAAAEVERAQVRGQ